MTRYRTGYRLERRVELLYEENGWLVTRFPKSGRGRHPADVLAIKRIGRQTHIHLVECKNASKEDRNKNAIYIEAQQIRRLTEAAKNHKAQALIAYSFPHQQVKIMQASRLRSSGKMFRVVREDGISMKEFLRTFV